jgi:ABC-type antimicrobial peptide transport system permease subunit
VAGRGAWALFANELGIVSSPILPGLGILLCIPAVLVIALLVAVGPAWFASRLQPATVLQAE